MIANRIDYVLSIVDRGMVKVLPPLSCCYVKVLGSRNVAAMQDAVRLVVVEMRLRGRREAEFAVHIEIRTAAAWILNRYRHRRRAEGQV